MRNRQDREQEGRGWAVLACLVLMGALSLAKPGISTAVESFSLGEANVVDAPQFSYEVAEVQFEAPRNFSSGDGSVRLSKVVKVVVRGEGFRPKATGPVVWFNGIPTLRTEVAEDGASVEALFLEPLPALEEAAAKLGRWELIYQPHQGANEVYRISPTVIDSTKADSRPVIRQLLLP